MNILVVGPHPDDQELGMGGTVALLASQGHRVVLLDMTDGEPTPMGDPETRAEEAADACAILNEASADGGSVTRHRLDLPNRTVVHTVESRHKVAGVIRRFEIDMLFTPYFEDAHPDHLAVTRIVEDARFDAKLTSLDMPGDDGKPPRYPKWLFHYYATHLRIVPSPSFLIDTSGFTGLKRRAILAYHSQFVANEKNRVVAEWIASADRFFGSRIGTDAAECFYAREPIGLTSLGALAI